MGQHPAIWAEGLEKRFGDTQALRGLDLAAQEGTVLGLLGPNGAGKTTAVRILATLLVPDAGHAEVAGLDVVGQADELRARIGLTGQFTAVDDYLTGRENLVMFGQLYHLPGKWVRRRADELLERFDLADAANRPMKTYSGGMRRRLDLAASLIISPPVLFLDEPTTGLDPRGRIAMWDIIAGLVTEGTTVLLTTQYLDEADQLANHIVVVDGGRVIAEGTSDQLKAQIGGERLDVTLVRGTALDAALRVFGNYSDGEPRVEPERRLISLAITQGAQQLPDIIRELDAAGIRLEDLNLRKPTLDDVFLSLTGHVAESTAKDETKPKSGARDERSSDNTEKVSI